MQKFSIETLVKATAINHPANSTLKLTVSGADLTNGPAKSISNGNNNIKK